MTTGVWILLLIAAILVIASLYLRVRRLEDEKEKLNEAWQQGVDEFQGMVYDEALTKAEEVAKERYETKLKNREDIIDSLRLRLAEEQAKVMNLVHPVSGIEDDTHA